MHFIAYLLTISVLFINRGSASSQPVYYNPDDIPKAIDLLIPDVSQSSGSKHGTKGRCPPCPFRKGPKSPVCEASVDLGFAVESSTSLGRVGPGNLRRLIHFVGLIARKFNLSKQGTRVGVVTFSSKSTLLFGMTERVGRIIEGLKNGIKAKYSDPKANTGRALEFAHKTLFKNSKRFNKVLVVMSDGRSSDSIDSAVKTLKASGVRIIPVGVGRYFDIHELNKMASRPYDNHVFTGEFTKLVHLRDGIVKTICNGIGGNLVSPCKRPCLCKKGPKSKPAKASDKLTPWPVKQGKETHLQNYLDFFLC